MGWIAAVEDALLERLRAVLAPGVRVFDSLPGAWTVDTLRRLMQQAPGVYVSWLGNRPVLASKTHVQARFDVYLVAANARGEQARRRGDRTAIGAYSMVEVATATLKDVSLAGYGRVSLTETRNLFQEALLDIGGTVYALGLSVDIDVSQPLDESSLAPFRIAHITTDIDPSQNDEPLVEDHVAIPQND